MVGGGSQELSAEAAASKSANFLLKERVEELTTALEAAADTLQAEIRRHDKELEDKLHEAVVNTRAQVEAEVKAEMDKRQWIIEVCRSSSQQGFWTTARPSWPRVADEGGEHST